LDDSDVNELVGLSTAATKQGISSQSETAKLLKAAQSATEGSKNIEPDTNDVSEDDIAALLKQLGEDQANQEIPSDNPPPYTERNEQAEETGNETQHKSTKEDDSDEVAAILSQLTDAARLEQKFKDSDTESTLPSVSTLSLPSVPTNAEEDFTLRLANLKSFAPQTANYTGREKGTINVFVPGLAKTQDDESMDWCGIRYSYLC
jgi:hypothetical protein